MTNNDIFWIYDPCILFDANNFYKIIPTSAMTYNQKLNAVTRLLIYLFIILLLTPACKYVYVPIACIIIIVMYYFVKNNNDIIKNNNSTKEKFESTDTGSLQNNLEKSSIQNNQTIEICHLPTKNNPFMNITLDDLMNNPSRLKACSIEKINDNLLRDVFSTTPNNFFGKSSHQRSFYTMPVTTNPNDQSGFANWLYQLPRTCKEDQTQCLRYEDLRFSRSNPTIDNLDQLNN